MTVHQRFQKDFVAPELAVRRGLNEVPRRSEPRGSASSYSIHNLVILLQEHVPPRTRPIDITDRQWLRQVWEEVFSRLIELKQVDANFARLMQQVCAVVINYDSVSAPGSYGGRHTAALLNSDRLKSGRARPQVQGLSSLTGQNHVFFYGDEGTRSPRAAKKYSREMMEAFWQDNWLRYMLLDNRPDNDPDRDPAVFTLNNMLLRRAVYPRPVLITWDERSPDATSWAASLAPVTIDVPHLISAPHEPVEGLDGFVSGFRAMFDQTKGRCRDRAGFEWAIDDRSIIQMLSALLRHFGSIGGNAFFTIPVMLLVDPAGTRAPRIHAELRAAVSVLLRLPRDDPEMVKAGWFFFDSFANRVLTSVLASEFMALADQRWERVRADSANLASHPIKNKSRPALAAQFALSSALNGISEIIEEMVITATPPAGGHRTAAAHSGFKITLEASQEALVKLRLLLMKARQFCAKAMTNVQILDGIVNLMSLLLDLRPELQEAIAQALDTPASRARKIDLYQVLSSAAEEVADKKLGTHGVRIQGPSSVSLKVPTRFGSPGLQKYRDLEKILYRAIFSELLQNAANYGIDPLDPKSEVIPVTIEPGSPFRLRNYVHHRAEKNLVEKARQVSSEAPEDRMSSGLYFVKRALAELSIGQIYARVRREKVEGSAVDREYFVWEYMIHIKGE